MRPSDPQPSEFVPDLIAWSASSGRDLPWRRSRDPWAILVSETMLQQTQVSRVVDRWQAFMARFPDAAGCAAADVGEVIRHWAGLGYNRRAVNLHRAATEVRARHGGVVPGDLTALLALPGVGAYTARAVLVFAYERDVGVVDINAARVLSRAVAGRRLGLAEAQRLADDLVPASAGWAYNQAVLDLGATICTPRPACDRCPVGAGCAWRMSGWSAPDPAVGSAGTGARQSVFAGSDRQGRGRLIDALRSGPLERADLAEAAGWAHDPERAARVAAALVAEGLAVIGPGSTMRLP